MPNFGDDCSFEGDCDYGTESCCGQTYPEIRCNCNDGSVLCFYTESCSNGCNNCGNISGICPDGTIIVPDPNNNCKLPDCPQIDTTCPVQKPNSGDYCTFKGNCDYDIESCCNQTTFPKIRCNCNSGTSLCFNTNIICITDECSP